MSVGAVCAATGLRGATLVYVAAWCFARACVPALCVCAHLRSVVVLLPVLALGPALLRRYPRGPLCSSSSATMCRLLRAASLAGQPCRRRFVNCHTGRVTDSHLDDLPVAARLTLTFFLKRRTVEKVDTRERTETHGGRCRAHDGRKRARARCCAVRGIVSSLTAPDRPRPVTASCGFSRCDGTADGPDTRGAGSSVERSSLFCACRIPGAATRSSMRSSTACWTVPAHGCVSGTGQRRTV